MLLFVSISQRKIVAQFQMVHCLILYEKSPNAVQCTASEIFRSEIQEVAAVLTASLILR